MGMASVITLSAFLLVALCNMITARTFDHSGGLKVCDGMHCSFAEDCPPVSGRCKNGCCVLSFLEFLLKHVPCPKIYKSRCKTSMDCPCEEKPLKCEENECVKDRSTSNQARNIHSTQS